MLVGGFRGVSREHTPKRWKTKLRYGRSPELSSKPNTFSWSTFWGLSHLERPERRFFRNMHFCQGMFGGPFGQVFNGFGVFRELSRGPGRSGMLPEKCERLF